MLKTLLASRLNSLFYSLFKGWKYNRKNSLAMKLGVGALAVYVVVCFGGLFMMMFGQICVPLCSIGLDWLYFAMVGIVSTALCFIGSIFTTQTQLYDAKDNELLLSMPVKPGYILLSRMLMLLILNYLFEILVAVPAMIVFLSSQPVSFLGVLIALLLFILLPLVSLTLSCIIGWIVALISSRMRNKSIVTTVLSVSFLLLYFYFYSKMNEYIQILITNGKDIAGAIKDALYPAYCFGTAISEQSFLSFIITVAFAVVPFIIVYLILSVSFIKITTTKRGTAKIKYVNKGLKERNVRVAIIDKEIGRFLSSPLYIMNGALGLILMVIGSVVILFKNDMLYSLCDQYNLSYIFVSAIVTAAFSFLASSNCISACSISLEGKSFWIPRSMPINEYDYLISKVLAHVTICSGPTLIASIIACFAVNSGIVMGIFIIVIPQLITLMMSLIGVMMNLFFPRFDWVSEANVIKQGMSTMITMFGGMGVTALLMLLYLLIIDFVPVSVYMIMVAVLVSAVCVLIYLFIKKRGVKMLSEM